MGIKRMDDGCRDEKDGWGGAYGGHGGKKRMRGKVRWEERGRWNEGRGKRQKEG